MKHLLVLAALILGLVTAAGARSLPTESTDWSRINRDQRVYFVYPQFSLSGGYFLRAASVCVNGDILQAKRRIEKCVETQGRDNRCVKFEWVLPSRPMSGTRRVCTNFQGPDERCTKWEDIPYSIATEYDIEVFRLRREREDEMPGRFMFTKSFTLADCE